MLTIERVEVNKQVKIGDLFDSLEFSSDIKPTDESGDSYRKCEWDIEVLGEGGYHKIEGLRWTKPEPVVSLRHRTTRVGCLDDSEPLSCSPEHLVKKVAATPSWVYVKDLKKDDIVVGINGARKVIEVSDQQRSERLCDIQVADVHCYFADGILSHNSHFLTSLGASALKQKKNVIHYTFELSEAKTGIRYDSNLCEIDSNDVFENKDVIREKYNEMSKQLGRLKIKFYPSGVATVNMIRAHIDKMSLKGFVPDLVLIDYADIMKSSRSYDSLRHEIKLVYTELRGLAEELSVPIWTACFHGDTEIASPSGKFKIRDKVGQSGFPVYSYNHSTKRLELRTVKSVYKSGENVEVWKVTLDNGREIVVTPNHKFMKRDGSYVELQNLSVGDSLMPFYTKHNQKDGRIMIYRNNGKWSYQYKMVGEWKFKDVPKLHQIHHKDFDKLNDSPDNLELLSISEHYKIHSRHMWDPHVPCSLAHLRDVYVKRMKEHNPMFRKDVRDKVSANRRGKCMGSSNPMKLIENQQKVSEALALSERFANYKKTVSDTQTKIWNSRSDEERQKIGEKIQLTRYGMSRDDRVSLIEVIALECKTRNEFLDRVKHIPLRGGDKLLIWKHKNHTIVKIEPFGKCDVYNMEVDDLHNYALDAGIVVKNSQSNKEGADADIIDLGNMAESYGKAAVADVVISLSRKAYEKASGWGRMFIAKNRAGRDGLVYPIKIDTARSMFFVSESTDDVQNAAQDGQAEAKKKLLAKLRELDKEGITSKNT